MNLITKLTHNLRALFRKEKLDADMAEEMRAHLEMQTRENLARGMPPEEARYAAQRQFGGVDQVKERAREQRGWVWIEQIAKDVRYAVRQLRRSPGFTTVALLSLAIGIGANTAIFSLLNLVWLRPLPVRNPHELVSLSWKADADGKGSTGNWAGGARFFDPATQRVTGADTFSLQEFRALEQAAHETAEVFAFGSFGLSYVVVEGQSEDSDWEYVSGGIHTALGLQPAAGRLLTAADDRPEAEAVAVISHRYWQHWFGGDPAAVGKRVVLHNVPLTIVGVLPANYYGLQFGREEEYAMPLSLLARMRFSMATEVLKDPGAIVWLHVMARPKPALTAAGAVARLQGVYQAIVRERRPETLNRAAVELPQLSFMPGAQGVTDNRKGSQLPLAILSGLAALLLAIACANIANLMLARGSMREKEIAVRLALGAGRGRVIRQLLTESVLLATLGGVAGMIFAYWGRDLLIAMKPIGDHVVLPPVPLDLRVGAFVLAVSAAACLGSGLWPAFRATRVDPAAGFKGGLTDFRGGVRRTLGLGGGLVIAQIALSLTLLVSAGLLIRTVHNLQTLDVGFSRGGRLVFGVRAKPPGYSVEQLAPMLEAIVEKVSALPGIRGATFARLQVLNHGYTPREVFLKGDAPASPSGLRAIGTNDVAENFFSSYEMPILLGRGFDARDRAGAPLVAVVNQAFARRYLGEGNPLGRRFGWSAATAGEIEITGLVADARTVHPREAPAPMIYTPFRQQRGTRTYFAVRAIREPRAMLSAVQQAVREVNPELLMAQIQTEEEIMDGFVAREKLIAVVATSFGVVAVPLVGIGLFGLVAYTVVRRTREIGIRMALGALPRDVLALLTRQFMRLAAWGIVAGVALAVAATRLLDTFLYGLPATDVATYGAVILLIASVTLLACWLPARRAAKVDPMVALRSE